MNAYKVKNQTQNVLKFSDQISDLFLKKSEIHVYNHYYQTSCSLKSLGQSKPNFMWSLLGSLEKKVYIKGTGHLTKMAAMLIYGKNFQKSSSKELIVV